MKFLTMDFWLMGQYFYCKGKDLNQSNVRQILK